MQAARALLSLPAARLLLLSGPFLVGCDPGALTCVHTSATYAGEAVGDTFTTELARSGGGGGSRHDSKPGYSQGSSCIDTTGDPDLITFDIAVWIDVDGDEDDCFYRAGCEPDKHDPQARATVVIPNGGDAHVELVVVDPPHR